MIIGDCSDYLGLDGQHGRHLEIFQIGCRPNFQEQRGRITYQTTQECSLKVIPGI